MKKLLFVTLLLSAISLTACGGSGRNANDQPPSKLHLWHNLDRVRIEKGDFENTVEELAKSQSITVENIMKGYADDLIKSMQYAEPAGQAPEMLASVIYEYVNPEYNTGTRWVTELAEVVMPLDEECSRYVKDNCDLDSYKDVVLDEQVYGFPLYSYETLARNPDTGEYDAPLYVRVFLSLGNYALQNKQGTKLYRAVVSFAQELSHIYRDKNII